MLDMFVEFDKALYAYTCGEIHILYHVIYHHIYRVAESRPEPSTVTFTPKIPKHFDIFMKRQPDRKQIFLLIQYIYNYIYTYCTLPPNLAILAYKSFIFLPYLPLPLRYSQYSGKLTDKEMDIFSRYIHHPSKADRGDQFLHNMNYRIRSLAFTHINSNPIIATI